MYIKTKFNHPLMTMKTIFQKKKTWLINLAWGISFIICGIFISPTQAWSETVGIPFPTYTPSPAPEKIIGPPGEQFTFTRTGKNTDNQFTLAEAMVPPGSGPSAHFHDDYDEWFYFPKGGFKLFLDPDHTYKNLNEIPNKNAPGADIQLITTKPKSLYYVPRGHIHGFYNDSDQPMPMTFVWAPERITQYFRDTGEPVESFPADFKADPSRLEPFVKDAPKYGINQSQYFMQYLNSISKATDETLASDDHLDELKSLLSTPLS